MSPEESGACGMRPTLTRYSGVTESAMVSPIASWKPSLALSRRIGGRPGVRARIEVVPQLVVDDGEVLGRLVDAHLEAKVVNLVDVPRARVADHLAVARFDEKRALPERRGQRLETERGEEALAVARHFDRRDPPSAQHGRQVHRPRAAWRGHVGIHVRPVLRPDVTEQMGGDGPVGRHGLAVALAQTGANVGVQRQVQRAKLPPQPIQLLRERVGRHVVLGAPHGAGVGESQLASALVGQLDEPRVALLHRRRD